MRSIVLVRSVEGKTRPALVLTPQEKRIVLTSTTVAPITSTIRGLTTEVAVGRDEGLDHDSVVNCDSISTIPNRLIGEEIGLFPSGREGVLREALLRALDF